MLKAALDAGNPIVRGASRCDSRVLCFFQSARVKEITILHSGGIRLFVRDFDPYM